MNEEFKSWSVNKIKNKSLLLYDNESHICKDAAPLLDPQFSIFSFVDHAARGTEHCK